MGIGAIIGIVIGIVILIVIILAAVKIIGMASKKNRTGKATYFQNRSSAEQPNNSGAISSNTCTNCGKQIQQGARYCSYCGHSI